jgi:hypothetical protein
MAESLFPNQSAAGISGLDDWISVPGLLPEDFSCPGPSRIDFTFGRIGGGMSVSGFISFWLRPCCSKPDLFSRFRVRPFFISGLNLFPICGNFVLELENLLEGPQGTRVLDAA